VGRPPLLTALVARAGASGRGELGRRAGWSLVIELLQLVSSVLVFFALAHLLDQQDFGTMAAVLGLAIPVASLTSFGSHALLIKRVSQGGDLPAAWRRATSVGVIGPAMGAMAVVGLKPLLLPHIDTMTYVLLVIGQLNFFWLTELAVFVGNGTRRLKEAAQIRFLVVALRMAALGLFVLVGGGSLRWWATASFVSFGLAALVAVGYVWRVFGARPSLTAFTLAELREGVPFSINAVSESLVDVSDRPLLARYNHEADAAIYSVAARIVQFGYLPLSVLLRASDADLFSAGRRGVRATMVVVRRLAPTAMAVGALVGLGFLLLAPLMPLVAGSDYGDSVTAIRLLAVIPFVRSVQYLMGNCLSVTGHQWWRVGATWAAATLNVGLNVRFLPAGTWRTACYTTIVSEIFLTAVLASAVTLWSMKERQTGSELEMALLDDP
jgi:O-antigen/teichoic acid export membrane protein